MVTDGRGEIVWSELEREEERMDQSKKQRGRKKERKRKRRNDSIRMIAFAGEARLRPLFQKGPKMSLSLFLSLSYSLKKSTQ
jgi:hypothetical protein